MRQPINKTGKRWAVVSTLVPVEAAHLSGKVDGKIEPLDLDAGFHIGMKVELFKGHKIIGQKQELGQDGKSIREIPTLDVPEHSFPQFDMTQKPPAAYIAPTKKSKVWDSFYSQWKGATRTELVALIAELWQQLGQRRDPMPWHFDLAREVLTEAGEQHHRDLVLSLGGDIHAELRKINHDLELQELNPNNLWRNHHEGGIGIDHEIANALEQRFTSSKAIQNRAKEQAEEIRKAARAIARAGAETAAEPLRLWLDPEAQGVIPAHLPLIVGRLLWAERAAQQKKRTLSLQRSARTATSGGGGIPDHWPMPVDSVAVRTFSALSGGQKGSPVLKKDAAAPKRLTIQWSDGEREELGPQHQLELDLYSPFHDPLVAVQRKYGPQAVGHLMSGIWLHWASQQPNGSTFPYWIDEEKEMLKLEDTRSIQRYHELLEKAILIAEYEDGETLEAPLRTLTTKQRKGKKLVGGTMQIHPALTRAIYQSGRKCYWAAPFAVFQLSYSNEGERDVTGLLPLFGQQWHMEMNRRKKEEPKFIKKTRELYEALGHSWRNDRKKDKRAGEKLGKILNAATQAGLCSYIVRDGRDLSDPDAVVEAIPGGEAIEYMLEKKAPLPPPLLPSTGDDLDLWLDERPESMAAIAKEMNINPKTLSRQRKKGPRNISGTLRSKLRELLWHPQPTDS
jgi:hypothetical protein